MGAVGWAVLGLVVWTVFGVPLGVVIGRYLRSRRPPRP